MDTTTEIMEKPTRPQPTLLPLEGAGDPYHAEPPDAQILMRWVVDQRGRSLHDLSEEAPHLVVFLRHFGCTFCREALADLAARRERLEARGVRLALVHLGDEELAERILGRFGLGSVSRFADPARRLYRSFGLRRGGLRQLLGWKTWWRGVVAGIVRRHGVGWMRGDPLQMPGAFLVEHGRIVTAFRHRSAADRPDYEAIATGPAAREDEVR